MTIDFTTIPLFNLITLIFGIIAVAIIAKRMGFTKIGAIEIDQSGHAANAMVIRQIDEIDSELHNHVWRMTSAMGRQFSFPSQELCYYAKRALMECVLNPMQFRASSNHFTRRLCPVENRKFYKADIIGSIKDYYIDVSPTTHICPEIGLLPEWSEVEKYYSEAVDRWIQHLGEMVRESCIKKVVVYKRALQMTKNNRYWKQVFEECLEKNEFYIKELKGI